MRPLVMRSRRRRSARARCNSPMEYSKQVTFRIIDAKCVLLLFRTLDPAAQVRVQEAHVARRVALTGVLNSLAIGSLQQEAGEALDILALCGLGLLLGANHANLTVLIANLQDSLLCELGELRLRRLAVSTPICIVHREGRPIRGTTLESLNEAAIEGNAEAVHHEESKDANDCEGEKYQLPTRHCLSG